MRNNPQLNLYQNNEQFGPQFLHITRPLLFITVGIGFKLSPATSHPWTPDVDEEVHNERRRGTTTNDDRGRGTTNKHQERNRNNQQAPTKEAKEEETKMTEEEEEEDEAE